MLCVYCVYSVLADLGCFEGFCSHAEVVRMLDYFCVYHVNAPGHIKDDAPLQYAPSPSSISSSSAYARLFSAPLVSSLAPSKSPAFPSKACDFFDVIDPLSIIANFFYSIVRALL